MRFAPVLVTIVLFLSFSQSSFGNELHVLAKQGKAQSVRERLYHEPQLINVADGFGRTILDFFEDARVRNEEMIGWLRRMGAVRSIPNPGLRMLAQTFYNAANVKLDEAMVIRDKESAQRFIAFMQNPSALPTLVDLTFQVDNSWGLAELVYVWTYMVEQREFFTRLKTLQLEELEVTNVDKKRGTMLMNRLLPLVAMFDLRLETLKLVGHFCHWTQDFERCRSALCAAAKTSKRLTKIDEDLEAEDDPARNRKIV